jgi:hypothetical protein
VKKFWKAVREGKGPRRWNVYFANQVAAGVEHLLGYECDEHLAGRPVELPSFQAERIGLLAMLLDEGEQDRILHAVQELLLNPAGRDRPRVDPAPVGPRAAGGEATRAAGPRCDPGTIFKLLYPAAMDLHCELARVGGGGMTAEEFERAEKAQLAEVLAAIVHLPGLVEPDQVADLRRRAIILACDVGKNPRASRRAALWSYAFNRYAADALGSLEWVQARQAARRVTGQPGG